jgi:hypothetical protein
MTHGLLDQQQNGRPLTIAPPKSVTVGVGDLPHAWPGLTG